MSILKWAIKHYRETEVYLVGMLWRTRLWRHRINSDLMGCKWVALYSVVLPKIQAQNNEEIDEIRIIPVAVECLIRRGLGRLSFRIGRWYFNFGWLTSNKTENNLHSYPSRSEPTRERPQLIDFRIYDLVRERRKYLVNLTAGDGYYIPRLMDGFFGIWWLARRSVALLVLLFFL